MVCAGYRREDIPGPVDGFGFLIPKAEGRRILGSRWDSATFANRAAEGRVLLTQILGGARNPELVKLGDDDKRRRRRLVEQGVRCDPTAVDVPVRRAVQRPEAGSKPRRGFRRTMQHFPIPAD